MMSNKEQAEHGSMNGEERLCRVWFWFSYDVIITLRLLDDCKLPRTEERRNLIGSAPIFQTRVQ
jgi:hypothetical protein